MINLASLISIMKESTQMSGFFIGGIHDNNFKFLKEILSIIVYTKKIF